MEVSKAYTRQSKEEYEKYLREYERIFGKKDKGNKLKKKGDKE
jgi:hypothetical protein